jgi:hypothetical protein
MDVVVIENVIDDRIEEVADQATAIASIMLFAVFDAH